MRYVEELRKLVGDCPLILTGSAVIIVDRQARVLLQKKLESEKWGLPGGYMELGERWEETARREVREKMGLNVGELALLGVFSGPEFYRKYKNGDEVFIVCAAYVTRDVKGELKLNPSEVLEANFFELSALPVEIDPPDQPILAKFMDDLRMIESLMKR